MQLFIMSLPWRLKTDLDNFEVVLAMLKWNMGVNVETLTKQVLLMHQTFSLAQSQDDPHTVRDSGSFFKSH